MIEPMKTMSLVCLATDKERALDALRDLGVVHPRLEYGETPEQASALRELDTISRLVDTLKSVKSEDDAPAHLFDNVLTIFPDFSPLDLAAQIRAIDEENERTRAELVEWDNELSELEPWGNYDPALLATLRHEYGLTIRTCSGSEKNPPVLPAHASLVKISASRGRIFYAAVSDQPIEGALDDVALPPHSREEIEDNRRYCLDRLDYNTHLLRLMTRYLPHLTHCVEEQQDRIDFLATRNSMGDASELTWLVGYVPACDEAKLRDLAHRQGWALLIEASSPDDKKVPTRLILPKWLQVSTPIFQFIGIRPSYNEFDISASFLIFLALFFAILVGDAGYGLTLFALVAAIRFKMPVAKRLPLNLMLVFLGTTVVWGALVGNYFGIAFEKLPAPLQTITIDWMVGGKKAMLQSYSQEFDLPVAQLNQANLQARGVSAEHVTVFADSMAKADSEAQRHMQLLCFVIGAIHLSIAHIWKILMMLNSPKLLGQAGWIAVIWGNLLLASQLVVNYPKNPAMMPLYITGGVLILFFSEPSWNPFKAALSGFGALFGGAINSFVDVLSYIRLFAVGLSSYYMAVTFNSLGTDLFKSGIAGILIGVVVILCGHLINVTLCALSVLVHGIRLNTLEFSGHIGIEWAGIAFRPFRRRIKPLAGEPAATPAA